MEKDIDKQPHEGSDELDSLRREITDGKEESEINRHSDELDSLHKEVMQTQDEKHIDTQKQHETAELQKEIRAAAAKLEVVNWKNIHLTEEMNEEQITALAQEGRKQSVQNVQTMIEKTSWIPKRLNS